MKPYALATMAQMMQEKSLELVKCSEIQTYSPFSLFYSFNFNFDKTGAVIDYRECPFRLLIENVGIRAKMMSHDLASSAPFPVFDKPFIPEDCITPYYMLKAGLVGMAGQNLTYYIRHPQSITHEKARAKSTFFADGALLSIGCLRDYLQKDHMLEEYNDLVDVMEVMYRIFDMESIFHNKNYSKEAKQEVTYLLNCLLYRKFPEFTDWPVFQRDFKEKRTLATKMILEYLKLHDFRAQKDVVKMNQENMTEEHAYQKVIELLTK